MISGVLDPVCDRCQHGSSYHHQHGCGACHYRECACAQFALTLALHESQRSLAA
jgi:hypothetical protein